MTTMGWVALGILSALVLGLLIWRFIDYLRRLQVRTNCWLVQGRTIGVEGTVRNMFRRHCSFQWNCECVDQLVGGESTPGGRLMEAIRACSQRRSFDETLFAGMQDCTTVRIHMWATGVGPNPTRIRGIALQLEGCGGRIFMSCEDALWFWWQLRMQAQQCCWT